MPETFDPNKFIADKIASGELTDARVALSEFRVSPRQFLRKYVLMVDEGMSRPSGVTIGYMRNDGRSPGTKEIKPTAFRPGSILGTLRKHGCEAIRVAIATPEPGYHAPVVAQVNIHYVPMLPGAAGPVWTPLTGAATLLFTVKLTGCTFIVRESGGQIACAHLQPGGGQTGEQLQNHVKTTLAGPAPGTRYFIYGREDYGGTSDAIVCGANVGGQWKIYSQETKMKTTIVNVAKIYPAK